MKVLLVCCWDGVSVWLQWDGAVPDAGYQVQVRYRRPAKGADPAPDWEGWMRVGGPGAVRRQWLVIPTHREGSAVQARVATFGADDWQAAAEATFRCSRGVFEISTASRRVHYAAGTIFHGIVDQAPASYRTLDEVELEPGQTGQVPVESLDPSGFHQLDGPDHFSLRPALGLTIRNVAASEDDLEETGRDFSELRPQARTAPLSVAFGATNHFDGSAVGGK